MIIVIRSAEMKRSHHSKRKLFCMSREVKKMGFIMIVFGLVTFCAFFLPLKAWILLLGLVMIYCGFQLTRWFR